MKSLKMNEVKVDKYDDLTKIIKEFLKGATVISIKYQGRTIGIIHYIKEFTINIKVLSRDEYCISFVDSKRFCSYRYLFDEIGIEC